MGKEAERVKAANHSIQKVIKLYQEIADLTFEHCSRTCRNLGSCCSAEYCVMAMQTAEQSFGLTLTPGKHPTLPMIGEDGKCMAPPHTRQLCSLHSCDIAGMGFFKGDRKLTNKYFALRNEVGEVQRVLSEEGVDTF